MNISRHPSELGTAKALDGSFEIIGEGNVTQRYMLEGKKQEITYTHALHMPTLNRNLISVSTLDKAGLVTTFAESQGVTQKAGRSVVLAGKMVNGMYLLEPLDEDPPKPLALSSLSQPVSLEQWH